MVIFALRWNSYDSVNIHGVNREVRHSGTLQSHRMEPIRFSRNGSAGLTELLVDDLPCFGYGRSSLN
jgi:hypothetical protein